MSEFNGEMRLRPVHEHKIGRLHINWRVGRYEWMWDLDWSKRWVGVVTPWLYVFIGVPMEDRE